METVNRQEDDSDRVSPDFDQEHNTVEDMDRHILERPPLSYLRPLILNGVYHDPDERVVRDLALITVADKPETNNHSATNLQLFEIVCYALELSGCLERREHIEAIQQQTKTYINDRTVDIYSPASIRVIADVDRALQIYDKRLEEIDRIVRMYRGASAKKKAQLAEQQSSPDIQTTACYREVDAMAQLATKGSRLFEPETLFDAKLVLTALIEQETDSIGRQQIVWT